MKFLPTALFLLLAIPSMALADSVKVSPEKTVIGQSVDIVISIDLAKNEKAAPPEEVKTPDGVDLAPSGDSALTKNDDGSFRQIFTITVTPYVTGEVTIEPINYTVINADGTLSKRSAGPVAFFVESVREGKADANELKDIKDQAEVKIRWREFITLALIVLAALIVGALLWRWWVKWQKNRPEIFIPPPPPRPAHEIAYEKLEKLKAKYTGQSYGNREFFFLLSEIVREYLENRYQILALERTTPELKREIDQSLIAGSVRTSIFDLLESCDEVKFAKGAPDVAPVGRSIAKAFSIVDETRVKTVESAE